VKVALYNWISKKDQWK